MSLKIAFVVLMAIAFGFILGYIPVLNEHLHWNLWYVVPISGLLFGIAAGGMQFAACYKMNQPVSRFLLIYLSFAAAIGYLSVDYGIYRSIRIDVKDAENMEDGTYALSDLISFWQYTRMNLGNSSVKTRYGTDSIEFGTVGTTVSYIADMLGALLGAGGTLVVCRQTHPFCAKCQKYKKRERYYDLMLKFEQTLADEILSGIHAQMKEGTYLHIVAHLQDLAGKHADKKGDLRIAVDQRCCPVCYEATFLGSVHRKKGNDWNEVSELKFQYHTTPAVLDQDQPAV